MTRVAFGGLSPTCAKTTARMRERRSMAQQHSKSPAAIQKVDPVWAKIRTEAEDVVRREPEIGTFIYSSILHHDTLEAAVVQRVSERLDPADIQAELMPQAHAAALGYHLQVTATVPAAVVTGVY